MKKIKYYVAALVIFCFMSGHSLAEIIYRTPLTVTSSGLFEYSGAADAQVFQSIIINSGQRSVNICNSDKTTYNLKYIKMIPRGLFTGKSFRTNSATPSVYLFSTSIPAYKVTPWYTSNAFNGEHMSATMVPTSIYHSETIVWDSKGRLMMDSQRKATNQADSTGGVRAYNGYYIYRGEEHIEGGEFTLNALPTNTLLEYYCYDDTDAVREVQPVQMLPILIKHTIASCDPVETGITIPMPSVSIAAIEAAKNTDNLLSTATRTFSLKCDPAVKVYFSVVDLVDQTNTSTTSKLTAASTATGVGYGVMFGTRLMRFGPDVSAKVNDNSIDRALIKETSGTNGNIPVSYSLIFGYKANGDAVSDGVANGIIGITYSYQ